MLPLRVPGAQLRRFRLTDLPAFQAYRHDPDVGRYQGWSPMPDDEAASFLANMSTAPLLQPGGWSQIAIAEQAGLRLWGDIGLRLASDGSEAEIGFTLAAAYQRRGIATAAVRAAIGLVFGHTTAARIIGITDARNEASVNLLERLGLQRTAEQQVMFRGEPCTEWVYMLARPRLA